MKGENSMKMKKVYPLGVGLLLLSGAVFAEYHPTSLASEFPDAKGLRDFSAYVQKKDPEHAQHILSATSGPWYKKQQQLAQAFFPKKENHQAARPAAPLPRANQSQNFSAYVQKKDPEHAQQILSATSGRWLEKQQQLALDFSAGR